MRLEGKKAFITGASRNIGRAIALAFAAEGADLVLNTRANREELDGVAAECRKAGVRAVSVLGDIADAGAVDAMVKQGIAELGAVDVLVCNAAIRPHTSVTETSIEDWHRVMCVNLHSAFYLARAVVPGMKERRQGSIIALGGQSSLTGRANTASVTAAKTGLLGLVRALAAELGPFGIRASMVIPGTMVSSGARRRRARRTLSRYRSAAPAGESRRPASSSPPTLQLHHGRRDPRDGRPHHRIKTRRAWGFLSFRSSWGER
jgi:3-oxoacyl-[acyl-carrier protein] reductase